MIKRQAAIGISLIIALGLAGWWRYNHRPITDNPTSRAPAPASSGLQPALAAVVATAHTSFPATLAWNTPAKQTEPRSSDLLKRLPVCKVLARRTATGANGGQLERILVTIDGRFPQIVVHREYSTPNSSPGTPIITREYAYVADHVLLRTEAGGSPAALGSVLKTLGYAEPQAVPGTSIFRLPLGRSDLAAVDDTLDRLQANGMPGLIAEPDFLLTTSDLLDSTHVIQNIDGVGLIDQLTQDWVRPPQEPVPVYGADVLAAQANTLLATLPDGSRVLQFETANTPNSFRPGVLIQNFWTKTLVSSDTSAVYIQNAYTSGYPVNGGNYVRVLSGDGGLEFTHKDGLPFKIHSIDISEYSTNFASPTTVVFTGLKADGSSVTQSFITDGIIDGTGSRTDFQTFTFPLTFDHIVKLTAGNPPYMMDNIVVTLDGQETPLPPDPDAPVIYDVNWDGPDCVVNSAPPVSGPRSISSINFGYPKVRSSFAGLTSRPLELIGGSQTSYGQIRFDLGRHAERYVFETDLVITQTTKPLTFFLDGSTGFASVTFNSSSITGFRTSVMSVSYTPTQVNHIRIEFTPSTRSLKLKLNGVDVYNGYSTDAFADVNAIRLSFTDTTATGGAAIDNVRIEAHMPSTQPVSAPGIAVFPNPTLYFPSTSTGGEVTRYVTLTNTGTADLVVSSITSSNASFLATAGTIPAIPPGGSFIASVKFKPLTSGLITGQLQITTNVIVTPVCTIGMQGTGLGAPSAYLNPTKLHAHIVAGTRGTESFTLGNTGNDTLDWRFIRAEGIGNPPPPPVVTNDPLLGQLWGLGLTENAGMDVSRAWNITTGSPDIVVAVIDTGVDRTHPDLIANIASNPAEIPGNGVDDDGNGYVDDVNGWNFSANTNDPTDLNGHGTHVSGTIAASGNNNIGVVGVARSSRILPVQFLSAAGVGYTSDAIAAVNYARIRGARLINASWGGGGYSILLHDQIAQFISDNHGLFVAAAGNNASNNDVAPTYPACYDLPGIVAVAATTSSDDLAFFSNYGRTTVDVSAPGSNILSSYLNSGYAFASGTSMATPHATGALALLFSRNPGLSGSDIKELLMDYSDYPPALNGRSASDGRINAWRSLDRAMLFWLSPSATHGSVPAGQSVSVPLCVDASLLPAGQYSASLAFQTNDPLHSLITLSVQLQVTPNNAFNHWTQQTFGQSDLLHDASASTWSMDGDPDNDQVPNLLEYLLARSATQPENVPPLEIHNDGINGACVTFETRIDTTGTNWTVEWSPSLADGSWSSDNLVIEELSRDETARTRALMARFTTQAIKPERAFFRLRAAPSN